MSVVYTTINGMIVHENRGGVESFYAPDTMGSTVALLNSSGVVTDTYTYWPYGEIRSHVGSSQTPFTFLGMIGYYTDVVGNFIYVRARYLRQALTRWQTVDPLWPREPACIYAGGQPTLSVDSSGLVAFKCEQCAVQLLLMYQYSQIHWCCHAYLHCLTCCILANEFDPGCALGAQSHQPGNSDSKKKSDRMSSCKLGAYSGVETADCSTFCSKQKSAAGNGSSGDSRCKGTTPDMPYWPAGGRLPPNCYNKSPWCKLW